VRRHLMVDFAHDRTRPVLYLIGACNLLRTSLARRDGPFDPWVPSGRFTLPARPFLFVFAGIALVSVAEFLGRWVSSTIVHPKRGTTVS
jgi:hypothetical protein